MNFTGITADLLRQVTRVITHKDCPDGIASAMIFHDALPSAAVEFIQYNTPEHRDLTATPGMLFCDMTPPRERVAEFVPVGAIVLDHHKGAHDIVAAFGERGVFADEKEDPGVSGALLAHHLWMMLTAGERRTDRERRTALSLAVLAGIRDTWQTQDPRWRAACAQAEALLFVAADYACGYKPLNHYGAADVDLGQVLLRKRQRDAHDIAEHKLYRLGGWRIFNDGEKSIGHEMISDVAEAVRELDQEAIGVCGFHYVVQSDGSMDLVFSLRSCGADILSIALANGGGGHSGAAGFSVPRTAYGHSWLDPVTIFDRCLPVPS